MNQLKKRTISALTFATIIFISIEFGFNTFLSLQILIGFIVLSELGKLLDMSKWIIIHYVLLIPLCYLLIIYPFIENIFLASSLVMHIFLVFNLFNGKIGKITRIQKHMICLTYLIMGFTLFINISIIDGYFDKLVILLIYLIIWLNDLFAFVIGRKFGKHKLFPSISPNKTWEGIIGSLILTLVFSIILSNYFLKTNINKVILISSTISIIGPIGDLIESKFKRQASLKDSGSIMPGHGGLYDRMDGTILLGPWLYLLLKFI
ncbi:phosphatidate cytidylyltransferase [Zobellia nedashkovskayae]|uniref:phosphatidate cytidylyltransferase n=1 Tax=Zobellia nedashkovskayae TaxID=2779510 RepID=UPI00188CD339|nr:phosphatidate cytidylyltransferase [Zobellia nedashkovskayae]